MTMNAGPQALPTTLATDAAPTVSGGAAARAHALKLSLDAAPSEPAAESSATPPGEASSAVDSGAGVPPPAMSKEAAERAERIARVRARDAAEVQKARTRQQGTARDTEVEALRKRVAELEPLNNVFSSEEALLAEAEKRDMSPEKLVQWMRKRITDPAAIAKRETQTEADKIRAEMKAQDERHQREIEAIKAEKRQAEQERVQGEKTTTFLSDAKAKEASHPRTARALAKWTDAGLINFVNHTVAPHLTEGYDPSELHDLLEDYFEKTDAFGGSAPTPEATPANGASRSQTKNGAGQPATTLSNALTSGRESLVEATPRNKLSREERLRLVRDELDRE